jgi:hypothetical protein
MWRFGIDLERSNGWADPGTAAFHGVIVLTKAAEGAHRVARSGQFSPIGRLLTLGRFFLKNYGRSPIVVLHLSTVTAVCHLWQEIGLGVILGHFFTKICLGFILGHFFHKRIRSPWSGTAGFAKKPLQCTFVGWP